jgi:hypothetical protein
MKHRSRSFHGDDLDGVERADDLTDPYDIIARVQTPSLDKLGRLWSPVSRLWTA